MIKNGLKPRKYDSRDRHFEYRKVFGSIDPSAIPAEYSADNGVTMPDQNADQAFTECTAYTVADIGFDEDGQEYSHDYNFMKALQIAGLPPDSQGTDLASAFRVPCLFGFLPKALAPVSSSQSGQAYAADQAHWPIALDQEAAKNMKPAYLGFSGPDYFNSIRSAMWISRSEKRTVGLGISWYQEFEAVGSDGLCPDSPQTVISSHSPKIAGWTRYNTAGGLIRGGEVFLKVKSWQGANYGDKGWIYFSQALTNKLLSEWGSDARMIEKVGTGTLAELKSRKINIIQALIAYLGNLIVWAKNHPVVTMQIDMSQTLEQKLEAAIIQVESGGDDNAIGDKGLTDHAYGPLQIRRPYLDDVNRVHGTLYKPEDMLGNRDLSLWVFRSYMDIYAILGRIGRPVTSEDKSRIHNGGPDGWKNADTLAYWASVQKYL